jgi:hypothetical protein
LFFIGVSRFETFGKPKPTGSGARLAVFEFLMAGASEEGCCVMRRCRFALLVDLFPSAPHAKPDQRDRPEKRQRHSIGQANDRGNAPARCVLDQRHDSLIF